MECVQSSSKRTVSLDLLRVIAAFAVVFAHFGLKIENASGSNVWQTYFLNAIIIWHIPCFVMISGRFFLDQNRTVTTKKIINSIIRFVVIFIVWNTIYQTYYICAGKYEGLNLKGIVCSGGALLGPYHFWYLWMLIPLYAVVPFLRKISDNKRMMEYFIILFVIIESLNKLGAGIPYIGENIPKILESAQPYFPMGYTGYYILGYYLYKYPLKGLKEKLLYITGVVLLVGMALLRIVIGDNELVITPYDYCSPTVIVFSAAIYHFFLHRVSNVQFSPKTERIIVKLAEYSLGVYVIHVLIAELFEDSVLYKTGLPELLMRPLKTGIVFAMSLILTIIIRKIPIIGKKII